MELNYDSIKELADEAVSQLPRLDNQLPLIRYYRSANSLLGQAKVYEAEDVIPLHKEYKEKDKCPTEKASAKKTAIQILDKLENLKKILAEKYKEKQRKREEELLLQQQQLEQQQQQLQQQEQLQREQQLQLQNNSASQFSSSDYNSASNDSHSFHNLLKEQQLLEKQQKVEYDKIAPSFTLPNKNPNDVQYNLPEYQFSSSAPTLPPSSKPAPSAPPPPSVADSLLISESNTTELSSFPSQPQVPPPTQQSQIQSQASTPQQSFPSSPYHSVPFQSLPQQQQQQQYAIASPFPQQSPYAHLPQHPLFIPQPQMGIPISMIPMPRQIPVNPTAPPAHLLQMTQHPNSIPSSSSIVKQQQPSKPPSENTPPTPKKELINGLRQMIIDVEVFNGFIDLAAYNTKRNIETCGILAGSLKQNVLYVTHVIIPKQEGSSDTCAMTNEEEVFEYQEKTGLLTFGWIHTHPNHDCFLSSVDMHTHCSYQFLLKEAIAVVVAPNASPNFGIFSLTDPYGLTSIQACPLKGFHPHDRGLYRNCSHVNIRKGSPSYRVVDLRNV